MASLALGTICTILLILVLPPIKNGLAGLADVNAMEVVGSECSVALGAFPLACVVACLDALEAEDVEALCQDSVLYSGVATGTRETSLGEAGGVS